MAGEGEAGIRIETAGKAEVGDARLVVGTDQDVRGFEVAMENTLFVGAPVGRRKQAPVGAGWPRADRRIGHGLGE
jgi:hypothetical protein